MGSYQVRLIQIGIDLRVLKTKEYSVRFRTPETEPHYRMQFSVIAGNIFLSGRYYPCEKDADFVF